MIQLLILADDFTGALDTGVQFSEKGIQTMVSTKIDIDFYQLDDKIQVLAVDTESRHLVAEEAYHSVKAIAQKAVEAGIGTIYKKIDSTLRGNIGSELTAVMDAVSSKTLMFIPGYPKAGRTTVDGYQYVNGVLLHETVFANDLLNPIKESDISAIINNQSPVQVTVVKREEIASFMKSNNERTIFVFDAQEDEDLKNIGFRLKKIDGLRWMAGCAGFAAILPEILGIKGSKLQFNIDNGNFLVICGSVNELSLHQIKYAEMHGFTSISLTPEQKVWSGFWETAEGKGLIDEIVVEIQQNSKFILKSVNSRVEIDECESYARSQNLKIDLLPLHIARNMGQLVKKILDKVELATLVVFGGDTAGAIMDAIQCYGMLTKKEISPGIALCEIISDNYKFNMVSKAGGFGKEDVLIEIEKYLCKGAEKC